ncbi:hypothetical protein [Gilvibacter sp. SZ-19]|uniref:hypothetical protein n=1 Tax=unclassified Gilvibacter TaxID=2625242 RepID=UPI000B3D0233|nr:hypothetical protein [Gilvibacter sp. SZ-19]ARV12420.1 hypothetical protein BTO09_08730 [Gilvibacter sp. SZ-19]
MGSKLFQLFEYVYLAMAAFSIYLVIANWEVDRGRAYLFAMFAVVAVFMFFFRRKFRRKMEDHKRNQ